MTTNFKELLRKNLDDVKKPEPLPEGSYRGTIFKFDFDVSARKQTPFVRFTVVPQEAMDGVDGDELATALQGKALSEKQFRKDYYLTEDALHRLKALIASMGIPVEGRTLDESLPETKGQNVIFEVTKRASEDGSVFYNDVGEMKGEG